MSSLSEVNPEPLAYCRPCRNAMIVIEKEAMGETYWCKLCGTIVEISFARPSVVIDKYMEQRSEIESVKL